MLDNLRAPTNEVYFHPAVYPADCRLHAAEQQGMREFAALTSPSVCRRTQDLGIELMNYFDLRESQ
jgi:hypothetical protein